MEVTLPPLLIRRAGGGVQPVRRGEDLRLPPVGLPSWVARRLLDRGMTWPRILVTLRCLTGRWSLRGVSRIPLERVGRCESPIAFPRLAELHCPTSTCAVNGEKPFFVIKLGSTRAKVPHS